MNAFRNDGEIPANVAVHRKRKSEATPVYDQVLAHGLKFSFKDLEANREGVMTEHQKEVLQKMRWWYVQPQFFGALISFIFVAIGVVLMMVDLEAAVKGFMLTLFCGLGLLVFFDRIFNIWGEISMDLSEGCVRANRGIVVLVPIKQQPYPYRDFCTLTIGGYNEFRLSEKAYLRFKHLGTYTIYYAPHSQIILSAEPVESI